MTQKDQIKVLEVGFTIVRADYFRMLIKQKTIESKDGWKNLETGFKTKKALESRMKKLLEQEYVIED